MLRQPIIPFSAEETARRGKGFYYNGHAYVHHSDLHHSQTAFHRFSGLQIVFILVLIEYIVMAFLLDWHATTLGILGFLTVMYFFDLLFNLYVIIKSYQEDSALTVEPQELLEKTDWPSYTVLCPLYKEWQVLPQFITAMSNLDYPKEKLQVMLLLEEDDVETISQVNSMYLPSYFQKVIVPHSKPKTKPKACNYGLQKATGEFVVIYDAEDVPDVLQLKKAVIAFEKAANNVICVQAKLNFYNPHQNLLSRIFTAEYSLWFDLILTGLQSINAPIPLGGTSNHFKVADLRKLRGWDSFNVTEDCDLGVRLVKKGYKTAIIDSVTLEEANTQVGNWFAQRSRWIKGYMQTYLLHMRNPFEFLDQPKKSHLLTFQLIVGIKIFSMFINPVLWAITVLYFAFRPTLGPLIDSFFPAPIFYIGVFTLTVGNFLYLYYYMIGCARHGHYSLIKYAVFVPFYWLSMSIAACLAVYKLLVAPHHWSKTKHGLHIKQTSKAVSRVQDNVKRIAVKRPQPIIHPSFFSIFKDNDITAIRKFDIIG